MQDNRKTIGVHSCASEATECVRDEAAGLLRQAHAAAEKMGIPEAGQIRRIQEREGLEF